MPNLPGTLSGSRVFRVAVAALMIGSAACAASMGTASPHQTAMQSMPVASDQPSPISSSAPPGERVVVTSRLLARHRKLTNNSCWLAVDGLGWPPMQSPDELATRIREQGMKVTPQRLAVIEALHGNGSHPTAEVVWAHVRERMPTVSLRTVYQALNDLVELGEVQMVELGNGAARFDPNLDQHDHFVCQNCERVYDVKSTRPRLVSSFPGTGDDTDGDAAQYLVDSAEVIFRGLCPACGG